MDGNGTPLIWAFSFLSAFALMQFVWAAAAGTRSRRRARMRERLRELGLRLPAAESAERITLLREEEGIEPSRFGRLLAALPGRSSLEMLLYQAGRPLGTQAFLAWTAALAVAGVAIGRVLTNHETLAVVGVALAALPTLAVWIMKLRRRRQFEWLLPEALDLLSRSLRAGHAVSVGLQMVGEEIAEPVGSEFAQVAEEMRFGLDLNLALANMAHRVDSTDLPFLVTALVIQRETGGNLAEILDNLSSIIRERHATYGKISALTAQTKWSANILLAAPFAFLGLMTMFRPDYIEPLYTTQAGRAMLIAAVCMTIVGYLLCRRAGVVRV